MTLIRPNYISSILRDSPPDYDWPKQNAFEELFSHKENPVVNGNMTFSPARARFSLYLAMAEWILWRFEGHGINFEQLNYFIEAMWASNVNQAYYFEGTEAWDYGTDYLWDRFEINADVDDTTTTVVVRLGNCLENSYPHFLDEVNPKSIEQFTYFVRHVLPEPRVFSVWFKVAMFRTSSFLNTAIREPLTAEQRQLPKEDERNPRNGRPMPREAFDPDFEWNEDESQTTELIHKFLQGLDHTQNPFLASPEVMLKRGFKGTPYHYTGPQE